MSNSGLSELRLDKLSIRNYKIHKEAKNVTFKPITVLLGPNSSGKSSLLHPLLILKQSYESTKALTSPVVINDDEYLKLGSYNDIIYNHNVRLNITYSFDMFKNNNKIDYLFKIGYNDKTKKLF